jgi:AcrR family transcriptional regulator
MPRKPAHQTVNRDAILQAAALVFQQRGYHGTTMSEIAEGVGLTAGSLYHHFDSKPSLLAAVLNGGLDTALTQIETIMAQTLPPDQMLRKMILVHIQNVTGNVAVGAALVFETRIILELEEVRDSFLKRRDVFETRYREVIERGIQSGVFRSVDVPVFTKALLGAHNWIGVWYRPTGRLSGEEIAERMADTWLAALGCAIVS